ncbi:Predicted glycosyltransferases [Marinactinospora thermotolerans DSM 45154]|uniref:Predicted glycosyltransferases n=1 Tax=Marinactinospora thermotolerans DSM 45154 TaxID=1122192 RepID=A0A1T4T4I8_9ACTN|nr:glycosyltransferase family 2 protein [Marinactinospora thermotolerans]SKA35415.1 Predicted glycosyltransferases [Marinactinospora thermotolerans DSM 45154]
MERATTRVFRNDWSVLTPPELGAWTPRLTVSVVIAACGDQRRLDLVLAALAAQTYPDRLFEVVVVDDHSVPPLRLPLIRPRSCRIEPAPAAGWGGGHARAYGAHITSGEIICWLDPDMIVDPRHIEAHARWHHLHPECVTLGGVRFAASHPTDPADIAVLARTGRLAEVVPGEHGHEWVERLLASSDDLRDPDHLGFLTHIGSNVALRRSLYEAAGGLDPALTLGQDTEFGYRLWQAGAVFVPERQATGRHLGPATVTRARVPSLRFRADVLAAYMPHPRSHRDRSPNTAGAARVPLVRAVVDVAGARYEVVRACVDRLLNCAESDLTVTLVADWDGCAGQRAGTAGPRLELRLIQANYLGDPRVSFSTSRPRTGFPSPYLLDVPVTRGVGRDTVSRLIERADRARAGLTELACADRPDGPVLRLWRTRALVRALRVRAPGEDLARVISQVHGRCRVQGEVEDMVELPGLPVEQLQSPVWPRREPGSVAGRIPGPPRAGKRQARVGRGRASLTYWRLHRAVPFLRPPLRAVRACVRLLRPTAV